MKRGRPPMKFSEDIAFWFGAMSDCELESLSGIKRCAIFYRRRLAGIARCPTRPPRVEGAYSLAARLMVRDLLPKVQSTTEIGKIMGISRQRAHQIAKRANVKLIWVAL